MKKILLPTDFSENSLNAIHYALQLFKNEFCEFYILNVQKASSFVSDDLMTLKPSESIYEALIESSKAQIDNLIKHLIVLHNNKSHEFISRVDYDNFINAINQIVSTEEIDLIIMGTKGSSNVEKVLFGSNTIRVMQRGSCPVLSIPGGYKFSALDHIAFTSNYHTKYIPKDLSPLIQLANQQQSKIDILHLQELEYLTEKQETNKAFLDAYFSNIDHKFIELDHTNLFKSISNYIKINNVGLLAMMSKKHSFLERLFTKHTVETFAFNLDIPFLDMENKGDLY